MLAFYALELVESIREEALYSRSIAIVMSRKARTWKPLYAPARRCLGV